jgi:hypothetical protein
MGRSGGRGPSRGPRLARKYEERAQHYRQRAREIRVTADKMRHAESRRMLRHLAHDYDLLAEKMDELARREPAAAPTSKKNTG